MSQLLHSAQAARKSSRTPSRRSSRVRTVLTQHFRHLQIEAVEATELSAFEHQTTTRALRPH